METSIALLAAVVFMIYGANQITRADREKKKRKELEAKIEYLQNK